MWFYGAIEQLLSGWVFDLIPGDASDFDRAREMLVETICGGLEARDAPVVGPAPPMWESLGIDAAAGSRRCTVRRRR